MALLSPASDSLSSLDSKLRHSAYAHLRVARAQCVYGFYFRTSGDALLPLSLTTLLCVMLSPSSDHHITPQIYISYEICGARRCSIPFTPSGRVGTGGMYEPNQFVMNCGVVDPSAGPIRFLLLLLVTSTTATPSTFSCATLTTRPLSLTTLLCVMLSPSSDHHITPQIYISYEICGARRCSIPFTPSGRVILHPPFLSNSDLLKIGPRNNMMNWSYDVIAGPIPTTFYWHSFHPLLIRYPRWTRNCVTRLTLI